MTAATDAAQLRQNIARLDAFMNGGAGAGVTLSDGTVIATLLGLIGTSASDTAPAVTWPSRLWIDTTDPLNPLLKVRDASDASWVTIDILGLQQTRYDTRAAAVAASIPATVDEIWIAGWGAANDGGYGRYKNVGADPGYPGAFQSANGRWWELMPAATGPCPEQFGAVLGTSANNASYVQDWLDFIVSSGCGRGIARGLYRVDATITLSDPDNVHIDCVGADWVLNADVLMFDLNARADPLYVDNESRQNFTWKGGIYRCWVGSPTKATAFRLFGMRKAELAPEEVNNFHTGIMLAGKDTIEVEKIKFLGNEIDVLFPPWSMQGGPLMVHLRNLHHSHGGKTQPCVKSYVPLNDCSIMDCSYNLGSNATCVAVDLQKVVLLGVAGGSGTWVPGETVTGGTSGATMVLDEVYDHPHAFQIAQNTRWLVGHTRTGTFVNAETVTGGTSGASAAIGGADDYVIQNPTWTQFKFGGTGHFEVGTGGSGATGIRIRDRVGTGADSLNFDIDIGKGFLSKGSAVAIELDRIKNAVIRGYFSLESGGTDTVLKTSATCQDIAIVKPFVAPNGTIDLNGMSRDQLDLSAFDRVLAPTDYGGGGTITTTAETETAIAASIRSPVAGMQPKAYDLRVRMNAATASAVSAPDDVRWRAFSTSGAAAASKQGIQIAGWHDAEDYWASMRVGANASGQFYWDATIAAGAGTTTIAPQIVGVHY